jgi:Amt family ammonium transporter
MHGVDTMTDWRKPLGGLALALALLGAPMAAAAQDVAPAAPAAAAAESPAEAQAGAPGGVAAAGGEEAPSAEAAAAEPEAPAPEKGDTTWMLISTVLVLLMIIPGLALFYGGLVRSKNMLSMLMQVSTVAAIGMICWVLWGYSLAFTDGGGLNSFVGGFSKAGLLGVGVTSNVETFSNGVVIPELVFVAFQMTFACITAALVLGSLAER